MNLVIEKGKNLKIFSKTIILFEIMCLTLNVSPGINFFLSHSHSLMHIHALTLFYYTHEDKIDLLKYVLSNPNVGHDQI